VDAVNELNHVRQFSVPLVPQFELVVRSLTTADGRDDAVKSDAVTGLDGSEIASTIASARLVDEPDELALARCVVPVFEASTVNAQAPD
jgi:hypothetical protein